jgi:hypothetical protein
MENGRKREEFPHPWKCSQFYVSPIFELSHLGLIGESLAGKWSGGAVNPTD